MHLIDALTAGVKGAENGTARLFVRGTTTRAVWYSTFEATTSNSSGDDLELDSNGGIVAYVNELVEVEVFSSQGVRVRDFVAGAQAYGVEVRSPSFTGVDYETGVSAVNKPTNLGAVLDRWADSAGAPDWNILVNGQSMTIADAVAAMSGFFYNVRAYGASGGGVANDKAAIQAAHDACLNTFGGGFVLFPDGDYLITSGLTNWDPRVGMIGVGGSGRARIFIDHATDATLSVIAGAADISMQIIGMRFEAQQANSGACLSMAHSKLELHQSIFGYHTNGFQQGKHVDITASCEVRATGNRFQRNAAAVKSWEVANAAAVKLKLSENHWTTSVVPASACLDLDGDDTGIVQLLGNYFSGSVGNIECGDTSVTAVGNYFGTGVVLALTVTSSLTLFYRGNRFDSSLVGTPITITGGRLDEESQIDLRHYKEANTLTAYTIPNLCESVEYTVTATVPTFAMPTGFHRGQRLKVMLKNNSGGGWAAPTFTGTTTFTGIAIPTFAATDKKTLDFIYTDIDAGAFSWRLWHASP